MPGRANNVIRYVAAMCRRNRPHDARQGRLDGERHEDTPVPAVGPAFLFRPDGVSRKPLWLRQSARTICGGYSGRALLGETSSAQRVRSGPMAGSHRHTMPRLLRRLPLGSQKSNRELSRLKWLTQNPEPRGGGVSAFPANNHGLFPVCRPSCRALCYEMARLGCE